MTFVGSNRPKEIYATLIANESLRLSELLSPFRMMLFPLSIVNFEERIMRRAEDLLDDAQDSIGAAKDLLSTQRWAKLCFMSQQAKGAAGTADQILTRMGEIVYEQA